MAKSKQSLVPNTESVELLDLLPRIMLFPGEDKLSFEDLRESFMIDLAPGTPYETALAENLVTLEWEAVRHRNMRDNLIRNEFREQSIGVFQEHKITSLIDFQQGEAAQELAGALLSSDLEQRGIAEAELEDIGITTSEILAEAYSRKSKFIELHERLLANIEVRRRRLRADFNSLKATRATPIEEADLLDDK